MRTNIFAAGADQHGDPIQRTTGGDACDREILTGSPVSSGMSFAAIVADVRRAFACPDCGKSRSVINTSSRHQSFRGERITAETHCACPGGPAYAGIGSTFVSKAS